MKQLKFRAWDSVNQKMVSQFSINNSEEEGWMRLTFLGDFSEYARTNNIQNTPGTLDVMQFTNLYDMDGIEIYEGDVLEYAQILRFQEDGDTSIRRSVVEYDKFGFAPMIHQVDVEDAWYNVKHIGYTVVGNIFESPDLLETLR